MPRPAETEIEQRQIWFNHGLPMNLARFSTKLASLPHHRTFGWAEFFPQLEVINASLLYGTTYLDLVAADGRRAQIPEQYIKLAQNLKPVPGEVTAIQFDALPPGRLLTDGCVSVMQDPNGRTLHSFQVSEHRSSDPEEIAHDLDRAFSVAEHVVGMWLDGEIKGPLAA